MHEPKVPYMLMTMATTYTRLYTKSYMNNLRGNCRVISLFALWFALNVVYNITNKWALEDVRVLVINNASQNDFEVTYLSSSLPITMGCIQFGVGSLYACVLWLLKIRPLPHYDELSRGVTVVIRNCCSIFLRTIRSAQFTESFRIAIVGQRERSSTTSPVMLRDSSKIAVHHTLGQLCTIMSLSTNSISFAHVIKAMEPLFSAVASWLVLGQVLNIRVYISLLPVVAGVALACAGAREFSWVSFWSGMGSNAFFAMRGVVSKIVMEKSVAHATSNLNDADVDQRVGGQFSPHLHLSPANLFAAVTCISFLFSIPLALISEGSILLMLASHSAERANQDLSRTLVYIISSGAFHYLNNEVMYVTLSKVHPITLAVGNTAKRVFIIVAGVLVFATPVSIQTAIGATIGIGGVFVYSLMKQWYGSQNNVSDEIEEDASETELAHTHIT